MTSHSTHDKWISPFHRGKPFHPCYVGQTIVHCTPWQTSARMLPWETMTIVALWETVATMPPSWFIPFMPQWQTISQSTSVMNCFTHSTHDEPFHPCYKWQTISLILPITNHCTNVIYKPTVPCCYKKPLQSCHQHKPFHPNYPWQIVLHFGWHGRKGLSKGYISRGLFVMVVYLRYFVVGGNSVIVLFLCGSCVCWLVIDQIWDKLRTPPSRIESMLDNR